jgi:large subunit ribosomal protein L32
MAVPKRKTGRARTNSRRSSHKLAAANTQVCPQCHEQKLPHHVCGFCGYYDGKDVVETKA